ncbi:uncharacterized protein LOC142879874 isoform X2 [Nelusetta ayraudi]|uniref:uncharacterized protein LOC142879874 isoform X2 n=1 Tax=Nelusetta ayraudi TaxID=303726 RepID=UPI003F6EC191
MPWSKVFGYFIRNTVATATEETFAVSPEVVDEDKIERLYKKSWNPKVKLQRLELLQQRVRKREMLVDDQPSVNQVRKSSLKHEECGHAQIKEEPEEFPRRELSLKQEPRDPKWSSVKEESHRTEDPTVDRNPEESSQEFGVIVSVVSLANCQLLRLTVNSDDSQSQDQKGGKRKDPASKGLTRRRHKGQANIVRTTIPSSSTCDKCGKDFEDGSRLLAHLLSHIDKNQVACKTCKIVFPRHNSLLHHIKTHTVERPHLCHACGKTFLFRSGLIYHMRQHTGERPHVCKTCGKGFSKFSHLKSHQTTHTGERPHVCKTCGKGFSQISHLKSHQTTHTGERPHVCKTCGRDFSFRSSLRSHVATHTGERPHVCKTCGKGFPQISHLKSHQTTHTGERPHVCKTCGRDFSFRSSLRSHVATHR